MKSFNPQPLSEHLYPMLISGRNQLLVIFHCPFIWNVWGKLFQMVNFSCGPGQSKTSSSLGKQLVMQGFEEIMAPVRSCSHLGVVEGTNRCVFENLSEDFL